MTSSLQGGLVLMVSTSIKGCTFRYFERKKNRFLYKNGQKNVFVTKYVILALNYPVVFERSDRSISSDDAKGGFICNVRG